MKHEKGLPLAPVMFCIGCRQRRGVSATWVGSVNKAGFEIIG